MKRTHYLKQNFVCDVCNRRLYSKAVVEFKLNKYDFDLTNVMYTVSVNFKYHIWKICHNSLKKSYILVQVVCDKLKHFCAPPELKNLNRLERILISQHILFKKVTIIPKSHFPKLKDAIFNIPIETADITQTHLQGVESNGILLVKLKRSLQFCALYCF